MAVAGVGHADAAGEVQVSPSGRVLESAPLAVFDKDVRDPAPNGREIVDRISVHEVHSVSETGSWIMEAGAENPASIPAVAWSISR
jgi:hypothetical protein